VAFPSLSQCYMYSHMRRLLRATMEGTTQSVPGPRTSATIISSARLQETGTYTTCPQRTLTRTRPRSTTI